MGSQQQHQLEQDDQLEYQRDHHASEAGLVQGLRKEDLELEALDPKKKTKYEEEEEKENLGLREELSVERIFEKQTVPSWKERLTVRAFFISCVLSVLFSVIVMKLNLTTGIIPSLSVSAGLLGFFFVRTWIKFLYRRPLQSPTLTHTLTPNTLAVSISLTFLVVAFLSYTKSSPSSFIFLIPTPNLSLTTKRRPIDLLCIVSHLVNLSSQTLVEEKGLKDETYTEDCVPKVKPFFI